MINIIMGNIIPNNNQLIAGNLNNDDTIDVLDVVSLVNLILSD